MQCTVKTPFGKRRLDMHATHHWMTRGERGGWTSILRNTHRGHTIKGPGSKEILERNLRDQYEKWDSRIQITGGERGCDSFSYVQNITEMK